MSDTMTTRRDLLVTLALGPALTVPALSGYSMTTKPSISNFGKTLSYLKDPALRHKEIGEVPLKVEGALFSGELFEDIEWRNISFVNCDFVGGYEIALTGCIDVHFENCRFSGILSWGDTLNVRFLRCAWAGQSVMYGEENSKNTVFESCLFFGASSDKNKWGAVGTHGEAHFIKCKAKWFNLEGDAKLTIQDCELEDVICEPSKKYSGSQVVIEKCKLRGLLRMAGGGTLMQSLSIRDSVLENLELSDATVKGDVLLERVRGGYINAYVKEARSLIVRNSQISGNGKKIFEAYAGGIKLIEIDSVIFGGDLSTEPVTIAGGTGADLSNVRARVNDSISIRKSKVPRLSTHHVHTSLLQLQDCELDSLDLSNSRIAKMAISSNTISRSVDFTNTQVKEGKVQALAKGQAKLNGSNVKAH